MDQATMTRRKCSALIAYMLRTAIYEPISPVPLGLFRIAFGCVLLLEAVYCINRRDLYFLEYPLRDQIPIGILVALGVWTASIICLILGFLTRFAACINYVCVVFFFRPNALFCYHADMLYLPAAFLTALLPMHRAWSVDGLLIRNIWGVDLSKIPVPRLYNNAIIYWVLGFMYFDSSISKLESAFWRNGLGFWLPASFPSFTMFSLNALLNQEWLVKCAGYLTLIFEVAFVFLFWIPAARIYLLVIGVLLHVGITTVFPIPLFGLLSLSIYVLFFPDPKLDSVCSVAKSLRRQLGLPEAKSVFGQNDMLLSKRDELLSSFIVILLAWLTVVQIGICFRVPLFKPELYRFLNRVLAVQRHDVLSDSAFNAMKMEVAVVYYDEVGEELWTPWITKEGYVGSEGYGRFWTFWWSASVPRNFEKKRELWARVSEAWAKRTGRALEAGFVVVKIRRPDMTRAWEKDRQLKNQAIPWTDFVKITWKGGMRHFERVKLQ
ncbi:MAG: hypothetical protein JWM11_6825 [Planctomycetaceae bacterium]|nr:hypothetical protein [Planctomycetaceae bacterium]